MLYTKTINDRQVFDSCKTIQMPNGQWVSNPSAEQIEAAGISTTTWTRGGSGIPSNWTVQDA